MPGLRLPSLLDSQVVVPAPRRDGALGRVVAFLADRPPLLVRYVLVSGVIGVSASIVQLWLMVWLYQAIVGNYNHLELNALWLINFEVGLLRNFGLHCAYTWRMPPTSERLKHAHVAATGAFVIDIICFNVVVALTGIIPLAQLLGAGSGFFFNFGYNKLKTFQRLNSGAPTHGDAS